MQLPKHKMAKVAAKKAQQRSPKHNKRERNAEQAQAMDDEPTSVTETAAAEEESAEESTAEEPVVNRVPTKLKSKEEKKVIRKARLTANVRKNLYKKRSGGVSAKNGPRAINQTSIIKL